MQENFDREAVLAEIIERELAMFLATNNEGGVSEGQTPFALCAKWPIPRTKMPCWIRTLPICGRRK